MKQYDSETVNIYLQGETALLLAKDNGKCMFYYVGHENGKIIVRDYRNDVAQIARDKIAGKDTEDFAHAFSQPASVSVEVKQNHIYIDINKQIEEEKEGWTLWLGSIDSHKLAAHNEVRWQHLEKIDENRIAFAAVVR